MARHSRSKNGVASAGLCPAIDVFAMLVFYGFLACHTRQPA
jgi:hypothetical protein